MSDKLKFEELVECYLNGGLDEEGKEELTLLLDGDSEARRRFVDRVQWDTQIWSALKGDSAIDTPAQVNLRLPTTNLGRPVFRKMVRAASLVITIIFLVFVGDRVFNQSDLTSLPPNDVRESSFPASIAKITGLNGNLIWTGDRGLIERELKVGSELAGGTIEGLAPDSWFELRFHDGSTIMISGSSLLTFGDDGQKRLRLREGNLSAKVVPQPRSKPMVVSTRFAALEVLGTQFNLDADTTSTELSVSDGAVVFKRYSDGEEVLVEAHYRVTTEQGSKLEPTRVPSFANAWKSQIDQNGGNYGKRLARTHNRRASLKAIPLVPADHPDVTLYLAGITVGGHDGPPVVLLPDSRFVVRGRLEKESRVYFGIRVNHPSGEYAGMFRGDLGTSQPISTIDENGLFEQVYALSQFVIDPVVLGRQGEYATSPIDLVLDGMWVFTHTNPASGLELLEVELLPPSKVDEKTGESPIQVLEGLQKGAGQ